MSSLSKETRNVQNPALGALLLWRFAVAYVEMHETASFAPLPLTFVVLPLLMHKDTASFIKSTQKNSGLRAFAGKFNESKNSKNDLITAIHPRALQLRKLTAKSIALAVAADLITIDSASGNVLPLSTTGAKYSIAKSVRELATNAEKLGVWFSKLTLHEISIALKIRF
ncbi:MAG: three component ABC system middle component [Acidobacteriota bacterium]